MRPDEVSAEEFEALVTRALDGVPAELVATTDNVVVLVEDEPPADQPGLLGLYVGVPLTARDSGYTFREPDRIMLFAGPLIRLSGDRDDLVEQVRITVVHEIAHHFGIDDDALESWGYG